MNALVNLDSDGIALQLDGKIWSRFDASLEIQSNPQKKYVRVKGTMRNDFFERARTEAISTIKRIAATAINGVTDAEKKVEKAQRDVNQLLVSMDNVRATIKKEREAILNALRNAENELDKAQREVDRLLKQVDELEKWYADLPTLDWLWKPSQVRDAISYGVEWLALMTAYGIAAGGLQLAKLVLEGLGLVVEFVPIELDPRFVALAAAYVTATGVLKGVLVVLEGSKVAIQVASYVAERIARLALGEIFTIQSATFDCELGGVTKAKRIGLRARIIFLRMTLDISFILDFDDIAGSIGSMVQGLLNAHVP